jgi:hypothetical protein
LRFDDAGAFANNGLARVKEKGKHGFIDLQGEFVIPPRFDFAQDFADNGLALVEEERKYGFIDKTGEFVIPPRFDEADSFDANGLAPVKVNGNWGGYVDQNGQMAFSVAALCGAKVLKNARNEIVWPQKSAEQICAEQGEEHRKK